ncbi:hypothetical protein BB934_41085 (plasmid) [Microvirga ossetica]|uniref:Antitoxin Xre/MbcA/ParS-like toxin-binding domain-containing protein n=1 Tax=Microvirga ossetica TaxID=1882682 RepID=A0A1B2EXB4_9HYPH|nr:hypothetical protein [Microvirga ossetica]ANY84583.1 hypothetical protein BB934_41085 [Microvirga ossetica]
MTTDLQALIAAGDIWKAELIEMAGGLYSLLEVASLLNVPEQLIEERRKVGTIIAVKTGDGHGYPACQFGPNGMAPGLSEALAVMPIRADWMRLEWLLVADDALDGLSPLESLRVGCVEEVIDIARAQGAD